MSAARPDFAAAADPRALHPGSGPGLVGITGADGALGARVAALLGRRGVVQRLVVPDPARAPRVIGAQVVWGGGYGDRSTMQPALEGVRTLLLVPAVGEPNRVGLEAALGDAAAAAGVERVVYLSSVDAGPSATSAAARDHHATEERLRASGMALAVLRAAPLLDDLPRLPGPDGAILGAAGGGSAAWVARDDVAEAAAAVLASDWAPGTVYRLTGERALTLAEVAASLSAVSSRRVSHRPAGEEELRSALSAHGASRYAVEDRVSAMLAIARGEAAAVSDDVRRLTGHPATSLEDFLAARPGAWAHLRVA